ncbi:MAG: lmo0937 family membrane protein [Candidatus Manganitrophus sp.]|nr:lmo0937 family membrane protein [Candidatus Manganitrophus sp.]WDT71363.1 MAG: lmo0937 family membrane protein [Candidatus Manganitrophus sp.]
MLWPILILLALWALGFTLNFTGGIIHLLLILAAVLLARSSVDGKKEYHRPAAIREFNGGLSISVLFLLLFLPAGCLRPESPQPALKVAREAALETKIQAFIAAEPMLDQERVRVEIDEGKIILKGKVEREEQKEKATEVAVRAGGDLPIENEIVVQG